MHFKSAAPFSSPVLKVRSICTLFPSCTSPPKYFIYKYIYIMKCVEIKNKKAQISFVLKRKTIKYWNLILPQCSYGEQENGNVNWTERNLFLHNRQIMICFVLTFIILFEFSMICQDFRVYILTRKWARRRLATHDK